MRSLGLSFVTSMRERLDRNRSYVMPVWLDDLKRWRDGMRLDVFIIAEVARLSSVPGDAVERWLATGRPFVILDNLSWLPRDRARSLLATVGDFAARYPGVGLLISANAETVRGISLPDTLSVLEVEPLSEAEVDRLLADFHATHSRLGHLVRRNAELRSAMQNRLFATVAVLSFRDDAPNLAALLRRPDAVEETIIGSYVDLMLRRRDVDDAPVVGSERLRFLAGLSWVAARLRTWGEHYFVDWLSYAWLARSPRRTFLSAATGAAVGCWRVPPSGSA